MGTLHDGARAYGINAIHTMPDSASASTSAAETGISEPYLTSSRTSHRSHANRYASRSVSEICEPEAPTLPDRFDTHRTGGIKSVEVLADGTTLTVATSGVVEQIRVSSANTSRRFGAERRKHCRLSRPHAP